MYFSFSVPRPAALVANSLSSCACSLPITPLVAEFFGQRRAELQRGSALFLDVRTAHVHILSDEQSETPLQLHGLCSLATCTRKPLIQIEIQTAPGRLTA